MAKQKKTERVSIRIEKDIIGWARKAAAKRRLPVSVIFRECVLAAFEKRHAK